MGASHQQVHRAKCLTKFHVLGGPAELALLGVTIGAAEIALLCDGERQRMNRRRGKRRIVNQRRLAHADAGQNLAHTVGGDRGAEAGEQVRRDVEQPAAVDHEQMMASLAFKQMDVGRARRAGRYETRSDG